MYTPVYPYLFVAVFKLFGVYSRKSLLAVRTLNSLFSAFTVLLLFHTGNRVGGPHLGKTEGWLWAVYPSVVAAADLNWSQSLAALSATLVRL
jgi:uncharacterized membrane protein